MKALLKKFQVIMYKSVAENFKAEGRPARWQALQDATLRARRQGKKAHLGQGMILQDTGRLRMSVDHGPPARGAVQKYSGLAVEFGTRVVYAAAHQFGVQKMISQSVREHQRIRTTESSVRNGKVLPRRTSIAFVKAHTRSLNMNLPARPFLIIQPRDRIVMKDILVKHFKAWQMATLVKGGK